MTAGAPLAERRCRTVARGTAPLDAADVSRLALDIPGWTIAGDVKRISRRFAFADFDAAFDFVGRIVALARDQDHHPDIGFGWGWAEIAFTTHTVGGLSENDLICAARVDHLQGG